MRPRSGPSEPHVTYAALAQQYLDGVRRLCAAEGWTSYADATTAWRALTAPGCIVVVAIERDVVGFAQLQSDGIVHAHVSNIAVAASHRRQGIGRRLLEIAFERSGARYLDLVSTEGAHDFYRSFDHKEFSGFRLYPRKPTP